MSRTNGVNLSFLKDCLTNKLCKHPYCNTKYMCTDIFTKFYAKKSSAEWEHVHTLVNIYSCLTEDGKPGFAITGGAWREILGRPGPGHKNLTTSPPAQTIEAVDNPDELPEAPAMAGPECFPTLDLYWEGGNIFDSEIGSHPSSCANPWYNVDAWALPAQQDSASLEKGRIYLKSDTRKASSTPGGSGGAVVSDNVELNDQGGDASLVGAAMTLESSPLRDVKSIYRRPIGSLTSANGWATGPLWSCGCHSRLQT